MSNEETPRMPAEAREAVAAEAEVRGEEVVGPVIPPERMPDFAREWRARPGLRCLIRAAEALGPERRRHSVALVGLAEMAASREWRREPGGRVPPELDWGWEGPERTFADCLLRALAEGTP